MPLLQIQEWMYIPPIFFLPIPIPSTPPPLQYTYILILLKMYWSRLINVCYRLIIPNHLQGYPKSLRVSTNIPSPHISKQPLHPPSTLPLVWLPFYTYSIPLSKASIYWIPITRPDTGGRNCFSYYQTLTHTHTASLCSSQYLRLY